MPLTRRPVIFIGSSSEAKAVASKIASLLAPVGECRVWDKGIFQVGGTTQSSLVEAIRGADFCIFVLSADDVGRSRGKTYMTPRDNVIFESGMSFGSLGPERTFLVPERNKQMKKPSDLDGFTTTTSYPRKGYGRAIDDIIEQIKFAITRIGARYIPSDKLIEKKQLEVLSRALINGATRSITLFGRDLSWARDYRDAIRTATKKGVVVEVFCERPTSDQWRTNLSMLDEAGVAVILCDFDLGLRLTMVDTNSHATAQFLLSSKERNQSGEFIYRCQLHTGSSSPILLVTLRKLYEALKSRTKQPPEVPT